MARRVVDLSAEGLATLPAPCARCLFWESADAAQGPPPGLEEVPSSKEAWWHATQLEWGAPGKVLYVDDEAVAFASLAPANHYPRTRRMRHLPSEDALVLAALWVAPEHRDSGLAKVLLHALLRETVRRRSRALEAYGARGLAARGQSCFIPEDFLLANGFEIHQDDPLHPLLRLDLRKTVRWQESLGHALEGVLSALGRREHSRAPARPALEVQRHPLPAGRDQTS